MEDAFLRGFAYESEVHPTLSQISGSQVGISGYGSIKTIKIETLDTVVLPHIRFMEELHLSSENDTNDLDNFFYKKKIS